ncbi:MAG: DUF4113 domain-containing protein, partial [Flavicella sp.]|nr:DUF4113 domain-containing protein [Flavicella sp.]
IVLKTPCPTNSSIELIQCANKGLQAIFKEPYQYKKAGVIVMGLTPSTQKQLALFSNENSKHTPLMDVVDRLNNAYGNQKIKFGGQALDRQWKMRQERLSPRYSTNIQEIISINS